MECSRVEFSHDLPVAVDQGFHHVALAQQFVPVHGVELERITFAFIPILGAAPAQVPGVVVQRQAIDGTEFSRTFAHDLFQKAARPIPLVVIGPGGDERQFLSVAAAPRRCIGEIPRHIPAR